MGRIARRISGSGLYHIIFRGINKQHLFEESSDYEKMKRILMVLKEEIGFEIYAYCLMSNHVHILLKEKEPMDISAIMKRLLTNYVRWYNVKYDRVGTLIANRYKSEPVEVDEYFLCLIRYIHQNPVKAGIVDRAEDYRWSSYREYTSSKIELVNREFVFSMMSKDAFKEFNELEENCIFEVSDKIKKTDEAIRREIVKKYKIEPKNICSMERNERNELLRQLKERYTIRQLERITGVSRGVIHKS